MLLIQTTALEQLAAYNRQRFKNLVIGITGSIGKTTCKEMLKLVLDAYATKGNLNNHYGVPLTLANMPLDAPYSIIEMGMNHPGEIEPLSRLAQPDMAIITIIAPAHLEAFDDIDGIAREKASICLGIKLNGTIFIPDNAVVRQYI